MMQRTAFDEASRQTYGRLYWTLTGLLLLVNVAAWLWGNDGVRFAISLVSIAYLVVVGVVNNVRMNRIARERSGEAGGALERDEG